MLASLLINTLAVLAVAYLLKGFQVRSFGSALFFTIILAVVNTLLRPLILLISLPFNILTLGLFTFVVNAAMLKLASSLTGGVKVDDWGTAILGAILLSLISGLLNWIIY